MLLLAARPIFVGCNLNNKTLGWGVGGGGGWGGNGNWGGGCVIGFRGGGWTPLHIANVKSVSSVCHACELWPNGNR